MMFETYFPALLLKLASLQLKTLDSWEGFLKGSFWDVLIHLLGLSKKNFCNNEQFLFIASLLYTFLRETMDLKKTFAQPRKFIL